MIGEDISFDKFLDDVKSGPYGNEYLDYVEDF